MKKRAFSLLFLFLVIFIVGCSDSNDSIEKELLNLEETDYDFESLCKNSTANWNDCSNKCILDNPYNDGICTQECEKLCECNDQDGMLCPLGYFCKQNNKINNSLGYCVREELVSLEECYDLNGSVEKKEDGCDVNEKRIAFVEGYDGIELCCLETQLLAGDAYNVAVEFCESVGSISGTNFIYNNYTNTWWFVLDLYQNNLKCNPTCVVYFNKTAEVNWRCTGLKL